MELEEDNESQLVEPIWIMDQQVFLKCSRLVQSIPQLQKRLLQYWLYFEMKSLRAFKNPADLPYDAVGFAASFKH